MGNRTRNEIEQRHKWQKQVLSAETDSLKELYAMEVKLEKARANASLTMDEFTMILDQEQLMHDRNVEMARQSRNRRIKASEGFLNASLQRLDAQKYEGMTLKDAEKVIFAQLQSHVFTNNSNMSEYNSTTAVLQFLYLQSLPEQLKNASIFEKGYNKVPMMMETAKATVNSVGAISIAGSN